MPHIELDSELLDYILTHDFKPGDRLPTINDLQDEKRLGISISKVREQLEVARALGLVEVRSKTGMRMKAYSFTPAVKLSLFCALALDPGSFELFSQLRNHIESSFWAEACATLLDEDKTEMRSCVEAARRKLTGTHITIPNDEHRRFHLTIFRRLDNPFVMGLLEAYWEAYQAVEISRYADYDYHQRVWDFHERILDAIVAGEIERARALFIEHTQLRRYQPNRHSPGSTLDEVQSQPVNGVHVKERP